MTVKKKPKNGTSADAMQDKKVLFVEAYLSNGGNATEAALAAGYSKGAASKAGYRLSKDVRVMSMIETRRAELFERREIERVRSTVSLELNTERLIKEISRVAFSDIRNIMHPDGRMKMPHELDDDTAAAIASFEFDIDGSIKYKFWDKNSSLERSSKIVGAFERDNKQKSDPLADLLKSLGGKVLGVTKEGEDE